MTGADETLIADLAVYTEECDRSTATEERRMKCRNCNSSEVYKQHGNKLATLFPG